MSEKRKREVEAPKPDYRPGNKKLKLALKQEKYKQKKQGFAVGPANLPDGTYKRKNQKIKDSLIQRAKIRKDYEKVKKRGGDPDEKRERIPQPASLQAEQPAPAEEEAVPEPAPEPEPEPEPQEPTINAFRQAQIDAEAIDPAPPEPQHIPGTLRTARERRERNPRKPKPQPFAREHELANRRKAEAEERRKAREEAERQRAVRLEERERFRRAMGKARQGGVNGQRKLGRESGVLLERVRRMVGGE